MKLLLFVPVLCVFAHEVPSTAEDLLADYARWVPRTMVHHGKYSMLKGGMSPEMSLTSVVPTTDGRALEVQVKWKSPAYKNDKDWVGVFSCDSRVDCKPLNPLQLME